MHKILLTGAFRYSDEQLRTIGGMGFDVSFMQYEDGALPLPADEVECVVCNGLFLHHDIGDFTVLKFIQLTSAGLDRVPVGEISRRGIVLHNARGVYNVPMAEWVVFRVLEHYKRADHFRDAQKSRQWCKNRDLREICGRRVAIVGAGNIGQTIARRFAAFDAHVTGFDIHCNATPFFDEMTLTGHLPQRIDEFDIVILAAPLTPATRHLVSGDLVARMKRDSMLVNVSRGGLVDEAALCDVLRSRTDICAALDVFESEPLAADSPLWRLPNVLVSPHNSFVSDGNAERLFGVICENLKNFTDTCL